MIVEVRKSVLKISMDYVEINRYNHKMTLAINWAHFSNAPRTIPSLSQSIKSRKMALMRSRHTNDLVRAGLGTHITVILQLLSDSMEKDSFQSILEVCSIDCKCDFIIMSIYFDVICRNILTQISSFLMSNWSRRGSRSLNE